jgi:transcriptional regulator with XRE-family HTH domain
MEDLKDRGIFLEKKDATRFLIQWHNIKHVGALVRYYREMSETSLRTFAKLVDVSPTYISFLERNKLKSPPTEKLIKKMAHVLNADEDEMLALAGKVSKEMILACSKNPRHLAELVKSAENLPVEEIEALTALAINRQAEIMAKKEVRNVGETKRKKK